MPNRASALKAIAEYLQASHKDMEPIADAYDAGYRTLVHRAMNAGSEPNTPNSINVGAHFDLTGGPQAVSRAAALRRNIANDMYALGTTPSRDDLNKFVRVHPLLARIENPLFATDDEINNPTLLARVLGREPSDRLYKASMKRFSPEVRKVEVPLDLPSMSTSIKLPVSTNALLQRRMIERELRRQGFDSVIYPNDVEHPNWTTRQNVHPDLMADLDRRVDFAKSMLELISPIPSAQSAESRWFNPAGTTINYSSLRNPFGERIKKRDWVTPGYSTGGAV